MTSVGFGNIAAETDNEKIFSICMMIVAGKQSFLSTNMYHNKCENNRRKKGQKLCLLRKLMLALDYHKA